MGVGLELSPVESKEKPVNVFFSLRMNHLINGRPCSLRQLSKLMNNAVAHSHICQLESGKTPSLSELIAYSDYFNVSIDYLLGRTVSCGNVEGVSKDSFNELVSSLYSSKDSSDRQMLDTLNCLVGTDAGLALLFYLNKFVNSESLDEDVFCALREWKELPGKESKSYQEIMLAIGNRIEK